MSDILCVCGHARWSHPPRPAIGFYCLAEGEEFGKPDKPCQCEGWQEPIVEGKPVFGRDRLPRKVAESAPAWPPNPPQVR